MSLSFAPALSLACFLFILWAIFGWEELPAGGKGGHSTGDHSILMGLLGFLMAPFIAVATLLFFLGKAALSLAPLFLEFVALMLRGCAWCIERLMIGARKCASVLSSFMRDRMATASRILRRLPSSLYRGLKHLLPDAIHLLSCFRRYIFSLVNALRRFFRASLLLCRRLFSSDVRLQMHSSRSLSKGDRSSLPGSREPWQALRRAFVRAHVRHRSPQTHQVHGNRFTRAVSRVSRLFAVVMRPSKDSVQSEHAEDVSSSLRFIGWRTRTKVRRHVR